MIEDQGDERLNQNESNHEQRHTEHERGAGDRRTWTPVTGADFAPVKGLTMLLRLTFAGMPNRSYSIQ